MLGFKRWLDQKGVFSRTPETRSAILYSDSRDKYFWIVKVKDWEDIHRPERWAGIVLNNRGPAIDILDGGSVKYFRLDDKDAPLDKVELAEPDMMNSDPDTRLYNTLKSALIDLASSF